MINKKYNNLNKRKKEFLTATPFPHLILDDFFTKSFYISVKHIRVILKPYNKVGARLPTFIKRL